MSIPTRVLVVYHHLPHYRRGVFEEMQRCRSIRFEFAADNASKDGSIPTLPTAAFQVFHRLHNHWCARILWQRGLLRLVGRRRFDAIIFLGDAAHASTWVGAVLARALGIRVLFWTIGWHRPERGIRRRVRIAFYRTAHRLLLYGKAATQLGVAHGYPMTRMRVVGNSLLSNNDVKDASNPTGLADLLPEPGSEVLTAVVRLNPEKSLAMVVEAAARLTARGRPVVVLLVGDGVEADRLRRLAEELGVDLIMPGPVYSAPELAMIYERTSVTVLPTFAGLTAIQSIQFGRPVITCDNIYRQMPESACVIPGRTGGLFADGSLDALEATIEDWLDRMKLNAEKIAKECRDEAEANWSPNAQARSITSAIVELLAGRKHHE